MTVLFCVVDVICASEKDYCLHHYCYYQYYFVFSVTIVSELFSLYIYFCYLFLYQYCLLILFSILFLFTIIIIIIIIMDFIFDKMTNFIFTCLKDVDDAFCVCFFVQSSNLVWLCLIMFIHWLYLLLHYYVKHLCFIALYHHIIFVLMSLTSITFLYWRPR